MDISAALAKEFDLKPQIAGNIITLIDEGNTIPFIARYRKEQTGEMDDQRLRSFGERLEYLRNMDKRRQTILDTITEQGKMTDVLQGKIEAAATLAELEDLYLPYRPKRRTRAMIAKEKGLEPLAERLMQQVRGEDPAELAVAYINEENGVADAETALAMARDILAEQMSDDADVRAELRVLMHKTGQLVSKLAEKSAKAKKEEAKAEANAEKADAEGGASRHTADVYRQYADYREPVSKVANHRILALGRGEKEGFLKVSVEADVDGAMHILSRHFVRGSLGSAEQVRLAAEDAWARLIEPSLEREIRSELTDRANTGAIQVFADNLHQLLMQPPIHGKVTLGVDPGYHHGCKLAVVDEGGKVLQTGKAFFTLPGSEQRKQQARQMILGMIRRHHVTAIAIGNGTASRESEQFIADLLPDAPGVAYTIVSEAGASVWSASEDAAKELPDYDVLDRGAISIARRMQDPLAELVKIDPKAIGVGQYQHDLKQSELEKSLSGVVEDCVSSVGVDVATASVALLTHVAGIGATLARNIVEYRDENSITSRAQLKKVPKLGPKAFEQCAGFLRIRGKEPLDATAVHPESYEIARALLGRMGVSEEQVRQGGIKGFSASVEKVGLEKLAQELEVGIPTLRDIAAELERPGRDPRDELPAPVLRRDVLSMEDLKPGMQLTGTVRNVTDFGAFVDIGVHQDGLVHLSQLSKKFVSRASDVVKVGDIVEVWVISVDVPRHRIALTMVKEKLPKQTGDQKGTKNV